MHGPRIPTTTGASIRTNAEVDVDRKKLAYCLVSARLKKHLSRREVAEKTGIPRESLRKYESGSMEPPATRLGALAAVYCLSLDDLFDIDGSTTHEPMGP